MEIIKKRLLLNNLTGDTVNFTVFLTQTYNNLGLQENVGISQDNATSIVILSGYTSDKLNSIKSFDFLNPYKEGVNGVTKVTETYVEYTIDDINYKTNFSDQSTTFSFITEREIINGNSFIGNDDSFGLIDKVQVNSDVNIIRPNNSIIEVVSKLQQISTTSEIDLFGNSFYNISNQTF